MIEPGTNMIAREVHAARRVGRLFKIERTGGFDRRPAATVRRLLDRRGALVTELLLVDGMRRSLPSPHSAELDQALRELASEIRQSLHHSERLMERLGTDLRIRRGAGLPTGIRDSADGRLLGRG
jgi:hypothetical protein